MISRPERLVMPEWSSTERKAWGEGAVKGGEVENKRSTTPQRQESAAGGGGGEEGDK